MNQEEIYRMQLLGQQIEQLQQYLAAITQQTEELTQAQTALEELKHVNKGEEIYVPVANGIFVKATIGNTDEFLTNVGAGVITQSTNERAQELIMQQIKELKGIQEELSGQFSELYQQYLSYQLSGEE